MNRQTFVAHLQIEVEVLEFWLDQKWLAPADGGVEPQFTDADIARAQLIRELKGGLGVNDPGIDVILHLLDQLHGFRRAFEGLQQNLLEPR